jgi:hypothetical protein
MYSWFYNSRISSQGSCKTGGQPAKFKTGGQPGDPLEMLIFNLTIHNLWGRVLTKYPQARTLRWLYKGYADDGYIKARMSVVLEVLTELKHVLKEDAGFDLNISKTSVLPKGVTHQVVFDAVHIIINNNPVLTLLNVDISLTSL